MLMGELLEDGGGDWLGWLVAITGSIRGCVYVAEYGCRCDDVLLFGRFQRE